MTYKTARAKLASVLLFLFSFRGRLGNGGYVLYYLFLALMAQVYQHTAKLAGGAEQLAQTRSGTAFIFGFSILIVTGMAAMTRRLHDFNMRGWWAVGVGLAAAAFKYPPLFYLFCLVIALPPGAAGANRFGAAPWSAWRAVQDLRLARVQRDFEAGKMDVAAFNARRAALLPKA